MGVYYSHYKQWQFLAVRTTVRPSKYKVILDPGIPTFSWKERGAELSQISEGQVFR